MKTRWGMLLIAADLVVLVALVFAYPQPMVGAGPLLAGHGPIASDCFACHRALRGASSERCVACHALPGIGLRTTLGQPLPPAGRPRVAFHQALLADDCMACHTDHRGAVQAKGSGPGFSHALLMPAAQLQCAGCHTPPGDALHRQIGGACQSCHTTRGWKPATFEHDRFFVLDRDHAAPCVTCHAGNDYARYTCYGCHEHSPARMQAEHRDIANFQNCVECHRSARDKPDKHHGGQRKRD
jgi:hypothetical protein